MRCGKPIKDEYKEYCSDCAKRTSHITQGRSLWLHKEPVSTAIYKFKYNNKRSWGELFAAEMAQAYKDQVIKWGIEEIIPIPLHKSRKRKRGYNQAEIIAKKLPLNYNEYGKIGIIGSIPKPDGNGRIVIATGGTSDMPVAEEAAVTSESLGNETVRLYDVGVSGLHRLLSHMDEIMSAQVIIAIAGMEGALASVIGGLSDCPVIAVPTSVGYGANFGGLSALLSMLNSCSSGVGVVNIDNGFGAAYLASTINHLKGGNEK